MHQALNQGGELGEIPFAPRSRRREKIPLPKINGGQGAKKEKRGHFLRHLGDRAKGVFLTRLGEGAPLFVSFFGRAKKESKQRTVY
ncbi:MAG: hypothetical protein ACKOAY_13395, partial [Haliscomenobacter sp.]